MMIENIKNIYVNDKYKLNHFLCCEKKKIDMSIYKRLKIQLRYKIENKWAASQCKIIWHWQLIITHNNNK